MDRVTGREQRRPGWSCGCRGRSGQARRQPARARPPARGPLRPQSRRCAQTATAEFPAIGLTTESHRDMRVTAQIKPISGREDQAAGVLLRVQDAKNYYIVRANALEGSVGVFKYVDGRRTEIKSGSVTVAAGSWQALRGEVVGTTIRGFVNGRLVVEADDAAFQAGGAGLWTKADSVTCFDDVSVGPVSGP